MKRFIAIFAITMVCATPAMARPDWSIAERSYISSVIIETIQKAEPIKVETHSVTSNYETIGHDYSDYKPAKVEDKHMVEAQKVHAQLTETYDPNSEPLSAEWIAQQFADLEALNK